MESALQHNDALWEMHAVVFSSDNLGQCAF